MIEFTKNYYDLLINDYSGINLTRITNFEEFKSKQIDDSIAPYKFSNIFKRSLDQKKIMIDVGFGGGFPILPMSKLREDYSFIGIETRNKKVKTVNEIANRLGLKNVYLHHNRIENVLIDVDCIVTLKAVGKVYDFLSKINTDRIIEVYFFKGPNFYDYEKDQIIESKKKWNIIEEKELQVEGTEKRLLIGFKNKKPIMSNKKVNQLVKVSTFH